jgi:hypothetical protein
MKAICWAFAKRAGHVLDQLLGDKIHPLTGEFSV